MKKKWTIIFFHNFYYIISTYIFIKTIFHFFDYQKIRKFEFKRISIRKVILERYSHS